MTTIRPLRRSTARCGALVFFIAAFAPLSVARTVERPHDFARWEPAIARFERQDREAPPAQGGVLFVGSSSVRLWDLEKSFPELKTINRGFGGSEIVDATHFADRLILPHRPRIVALYAGDNDLSRGRTAVQVAADFREFARSVRTALPEAKVVYIGIKPSISRWKLWETMQRANALIREECARHESLEFVDVAPAMLGDDGRPRPELFVADGLHLSDKGYAVWTELVAPYLE